MLGDIKISGAYSSCEFGSRLGRKRRDRSSDDNGFERCEALCLEESGWR